MAKQQTAYMIDKLGTKLKHQAVIFDEDDDCFFITNIFPMNGRYISSRNIFKNLKEAKKPDEITNIWQKYCQVVHQRIQHPVGRLSDFNTEKKLYVYGLAAKLNKETLKLEDASFDKIDLSNITFQDVQDDFLGKFDSNFDFDRKKKQQSDYFNNESDLIERFSKASRRHWHFFGQKDYLQNILRLTTLVGHMAAGHVAQVNNIPVIYSNYANCKRDGVLSKKLSLHTNAIGKSAKPEQSAIPYPMVQTSSVAIDRLTDMINLAQIHCHMSQFVGGADATFLALPAETIDVIAAIENTKLEEKYKIHQIYTGVPIDRTMIWNPNIRHKQVNKAITDFKNSNNIDEFIEIGDNYGQKHKKGINTIHKNEVKSRRFKWQ